MATVISKRESNGTRRVQFECTGPSKVEQSHRDECNINTIMAKCARTGLINQRSDVGTYGDFSSSVDYHTAQNKIVEANQAFDKLPSNIRKRFRNNPAELLDFINNEENETEARELGILNPETIPAEGDHEVPETAGTGSSEPVADATASA